MFSDTKAWTVSQKTLFQCRFIEYNPFKKHSSMIDERYKEGFLMTTNMEAPTLEESLRAFEGKPLPPNLRRPKRNTLIIFFTVGLVGGFLEGIWPQEEACPFIEATTLIISTIIAMCWCYLDARERDYKISFRLSLLLFLLLPAGFSYYLKKTRQNTALLKILAIETIVFLAYSAIYCLSYELGCMIYNARYA